MAMIAGQRRAYDVFGIGRTVKRYKHKIGDVVRFRSALGSLNDKTMAPVVLALGKEDIEVLEVGDCDQVKICNKDGVEDIVPGIWLIPSIVSDLEDNPADALTTT